MTAQSKGRKAVGVNTTFIQMTNIDLDATVILCCDQLIGPRAAHQKDRKRKTFNDVLIEHNTCKTETY